MDWFLALSRYVDTTAALLAALLVSSVMLWSSTWRSWRMCREIERLDEVVDSQLTYISTLEDERAELLDEKMEYIARYGVITGRAGRGADVD